MAVTCQPADMLSAVMSVKCFHAILGEDSVSCGCEITHTFKNTPLLTGIFIDVLGLCWRVRTQGDALSCIIPAMLFFPLLLEEPPR